MLPLLCYLCSFTFLCDLGNSLVLIQLCLFGTWLIICYSSRDRGDKMWQRYGCSHTYTHTKRMERDGGSQCVAGWDSMLRVKWPEWALVSSIFSVARHSPALKFNENPFHLGWPASLNLSPSLFASLSVFVVRESDGIISQVATHNIVWDSNFYPLVTQCPVQKCLCMLI